MQPTQYPVPYNKLQALWEHFMATETLLQWDDYIPDSAVIRSWKRCVMRHNPHQSPRIVTENASSLLATLNSQSGLLAVATPHLEDIFQYVEGSGSAILLTDGTGCVLTIIGDREMVSVIEEYHLGQGAFWSEPYRATSAIGLALIDAIPVQVVGAEHYFSAYHNLVSTAAPVHHVNGRIIGTVAIISHAEIATSYTLALVMAVTRAIGNQLQTDLYLEEANYRLTEIKTILESISAGVVAWNQAGYITHINARAGEILGVNPGAITGKPLVNWLELPVAVQEAVASRRSLQEIEATLQVNETQIQVSISLQIIPGETGNTAEYIVLLRPIEELRNLFHRQSGARTSVDLKDPAWQSSVMRPVMRQIRLAARGSAPALFYGESGAGKNYLARLTHNSSHRENQPFVVLNCHAVPRELMLQEFLGYEHPVVGGQPSKFELAHQGTLVFDQIESLTLEMQEVLLQVIETGYVMRPGSHYPVVVDVRIIGTSAADLEQAVAEGRFISNLYYRFSVFNIYVPPLRERPEDISLLVERSLQRIARSQPRDEKVSIEDECLEMLMAYPWPGNIRELESVLEQAFYQRHNAGTLNVADFPPEIRKGRVIEEAAPRAQPVITLLEAEREAIMRAGWACRGHVTRMAEVLGISRTTLWRRMRLFEISPEEFKVQ